MHILAIDVEATGQSVVDHFMTQFGAALISPEGRVIATYTSYLAQPEGRDWEKRCIDEFWVKYPERYGETLMQLKKARPALEVMREFRAWVATVTDGLQEVVVIFDTASYDGAWMDSYLGLTGISCLYLLGDYNPTYDVTSYMRGMAEILPFAGSSSAAFEKKYGTFPPAPVKKDHNPVNDAITIGLKAARVFNMIRHWSMLDEEA